MTKKKEQANNLQARIGRSEIASAEILMIVMDVMNVMNVKIVMSVMDVMNVKIVSSANRAEIVKVRRAKIATRDETVKALMKRSSATSAKNGVGVAATTTEGTDERSHPLDAKSRCSSVNHSKRSQFSLPLFIYMVILEI